MPRVGIFWEDTDFGSLYGEFDPKGDAEEVFEEYAQQILADARANAPWQDRTGDARAGLGVEVTSSLSSVQLTLYHSVEYGQWLETIQGGNFAVIMPTLERWAPRLFREVGASDMTTSEGDII